VTHQIDCFKCYTVGVSQGEHTGMAEERDRIIALLKAEEKRLFLEDQLPVASYIFGMAIDLITKNRSGSGEH